MNRIYGAIAIFAGWLSIGVGAAAGLGPLPPLAVYGVSGAVVLWSWVALAVVTAVPAAMAMVAPDPRHPLRLTAVAMVGAAIILAPDPLGSAFGWPLAGGAVCLWIGGEWIHRDALAVETAGPAPEPADPIPAASARPGTAPASSDPTAAATVAPEPPRRGPSLSSGRGRRASRRTPEFDYEVCPWCSAPVPPRADQCPSCHALLDAPAADEIPIPGLTVVPPELRRYEARARQGKKTSLLSMIFSREPAPRATDAQPPSDPAALLPPSPALKAEMARVDADIAAGLVPLDDEPPAAPERPPAAPRRRKPRP